MKLIQTVRYAIALLWLSSLGGGVVFAAPTAGTEPEPDTTALVRVGTDAQIQNGQARFGFAIDDKHLIAELSPTAVGAPVLVQVMDGTIYRAEVIAIERASQLALLKVDGEVVLTPYRLAREPGESERRVTGLTGEWGHFNVISGALAEVQTATRNRPEYYLHNAVVAAANYGSPLFNNCDEVIGVMVAAPKGGWLSRPAAGLAYAVTMGWLLQAFADVGVAPPRVTTECVSQAKQAEQTRENAAALQSELVEAIDRMEQLTDSSEAERQRLETEIAARQQAADVAQVAASAAQAQVVALQDAVSTAAQSQQKLLWFALVGLGLLLVLFALFWFFKQRAVKQARQQAAVAHANLSKQAAAAARLSQIPTVFLEGRDDGRTIAVRVPGSSIAAGAVLGRNPKDSDFIINHPEVSRRHCRLFCADGDSQVCIRDLGSTNGLTVDGKTIAADQSAVLHDKSRVAFGHLQLSVRLEVE